MTFAAGDLCLFRSKPLTIRRANDDTARVCAGIGCTVIRLEM
jgi:hypothetical protein